MINRRFFSRISRFPSLFEEITLRPAQTILLSFLSVIAAGTVLLMMPFTAASGKGLTLLNAFFTSTSAVCVTGLAVVDTASAFTLWGKLIILILIQTGGIGIMILSYFTIFSLKKRVSIEEKAVLSYMLNEDDMAHISRNIKTIIHTTFMIEAAGAVILTVPFMKSGMTFPSALSYSLFHSVSAFCNAGFSLFSDSLERFKNSITVNMTISLLIISGGLSFAVLTNVRDKTVWKIRRLIHKPGNGYVKLNVNSKVVLTSTAILLVLGTFFVYGLEHSASLSDYPMGNQYLAAFFQSVTLRTAGFNTISFSGLTTTTLMVMTVFMFIGAAAGSTAGGIKVNNAAVITAHVKSVLTNRDTAVLFNHSIPKEKILKSMLILIFGIVSVMTGVIILSFTEKAELKNIIFETVSAFGTVGLSTGITGSMSAPGKIVISILMFIGRLGPLTILAAASRNTKKIKIQYPVGNISIG